MIESGDELIRGGVGRRELARYFPMPLLATVGDEIADGAVRGRPPSGRSRCSTRRGSTIRCAGSSTTPAPTGGRCSPGSCSPTTTATSTSSSAGASSSCTQGGRRQAHRCRAMSSIVVASRRPKRRRGPARVAWHRFQMPAYHLRARRRPGRSRLVNIGVGPSNAKTITDHLAVLRPHCWLMIGHCARPAAVAGDRRLRAGARLSARSDHILDDAVPPECRSRRWPKCRSRCRRRSARSPATAGEALKRRLRTGTVVTNDDRNWELRWTQERRRINLSRAIAVDMEIGDPRHAGLPPARALRHAAVRLRQAAARRDQAAGRGQRLLPASASASTCRSASRRSTCCASQRDTLHSRKLRSFDEPPFR